MAGKKKPWPHDPRVRELLLAFLKMASITRRSYAVGGALAMSAHGYVRQTSDVDAFLLDEHRLEWLRAARSVGLIVDEVFSKVHYMAFFPRHGDPRIRIDMLFPADEPELSAVEYPVRASIGGIATNVFPLALLAIDKFASDRPEDHRDFERMLHLGMFDPADLRVIIASFDPDMAKRFDLAISDLSIADRRVKPVPSNRIPRK